jgi:hypothetical protein
MVPAMRVDPDKAALVLLIALRLQADPDIRTKDDCVAYLAHLGRTGEA